MDCLSPSPSPSLLVGVRMRFMRPGTRGIGTAFCRHPEVSMAHRPKTSPTPTPVDINLTTIALSIIVGDGMARDLLERVRGMSPKSRAERGAARAAGDTERAEAEHTA